MSTATLPDHILSRQNLYLDHSAQQTDSLLHTHSYEVCRNPEQFYQMADDWNPLLQDSSANSVFLTWEWVKTWWQFFNWDSELWVITVHNYYGELVGIAPLVIKNQRRLSGLNNRQLVFLGHGLAAPDHLDFIIRQGYEDQVSRIFTTLIREERQQWDEINFQGIKPDSIVVSELISDLIHPHKFVTEHDCPYLLLPENWETLKSSLSSSMRYNLGRFERRLDKDYPHSVSFKQVEDLDQFMPVLFELHTRAQNRKNNAGLFSHKLMQDFHKEIATIFIKNDWLRCYTLDVGQNSIAALYCYQYNGTVSFYQSGFDLFWKIYSPGTLIMMHAIKQAISEKNKVFDFLRGSEDYKYNWTKKNYSNLYVSIPVSIKSQIRSQVRYYGKKIKARL
jgi:CelD/BcsL family acetyltransferase involved in cellulose biosynthesis